MALGRNGRSGAVATRCCRLAAVRHCQGVLWVIWLEPNTAPPMHSGRAGERWAVQTNAAKGLRFRTFPYILCVQACTLLPTATAPTECAVGLDG